MWASPNLAGVRQEGRGVTGTEQEVPTLPLPDGYKIAPGLGQPLFQLLPPGDGVARDEGALAVGQRPLPRSTYAG